MKDGEGSHRTRVYVSSTGHTHLHWLHGKYDGLGLMLNAYDVDRSPYSYMPYVVDNGAYIAWQQGLNLDVSRFWHGISKIRMFGRKPEWVIVPDALGDSDTTLRYWRQFSGELRAMGFSLAFAVQDGMTPANVPDCDVVFVGGTTDWKWRTVAQWSKVFERVHVGRVNTLERLLYCHDLNVESVDGTGWWHKDSGQFDDLRYYFEYCAGERARTFQMHLCGDSE